MSDSQLPSTDEPNSTPATSSPESQWQLIKFHGNGGEYFRIWIVNLVLTLLTLGIYSAWATVRERRYFYGHTEVAGGRLDFHGKPLQILLGRIIAIVLLIGWSQGALLHTAIPFISAAIVLGLLPMFMVRALGFRLRHTSLRNIRFGFNGKISDAYKALWPYLVALLIAAAGIIHISNEILAWSEDMEQRAEQRYEEQAEQELLEESESAITEYDYNEEDGSISPEFSADDIRNDAQSSEDIDPFAGMEDFTRLMGFYGLIVMAMCFIFPLFICDVRNFNTRHSQYGQSTFNVDLKRGRFSEHFWIAFGISIAAGLALVLIFSIVAGVAAAIIFGFGIEFEGGASMAILITLAIVFVYGLMIASYMAAYAYWRGRIFNDTFDTLTLADIKFRSNLSIYAYAKLWVINTVLMVITLGFAYPWIKIRILKMQIEALEYRGDSDQFIAHNQQHTNAVGDEVGEAFDFDFGF